MRTFLLLSAIPGSGKSTWAKNYQREHPNTFIVSSDELRREIGGDVQNFDHEAEVWAAFIRRINEYGAAHEDCQVIGDATNIKNDFRHYYGEQTKVFDKKILVFFDIPFEIAEANNQRRDPAAVVPEEAMKRMEAEWEKPSPDLNDLYDEIWIIGIEETNALFSKK